MVLAKLGNQLLSITLHGPILSLAWQAPTSRMRLDGAPTDIAGKRAEPHPEKAGRPTPDPNEPCGPEAESVQGKRHFDCGCGLKFLSYAATRLRPRAPVACASDSFHPQQLKDPLRKRF
jgi:hypothetical protein